MFFILKFKKKFFSKKRQFFMNINILVFFYKKKPNLKKLNLVFVGVARFELATSCSQSRRDNRATLHPEFCGERGIRTLGTQNRYASLANWWIKPLSHLSIKERHKCKSFFLKKKFFKCFF